MSLIAFLHPQMFPYHEKAAMLDIASLCFCRKAVTGWRFVQDDLMRRHRFTRRCHSSFGMYLATVLPLGSPIRSFSFDACPSTIQLSISRDSIYLHSYSFSLNLFNSLHFGALGKNGRISLNAYTLVSCRNYLTIEVLRMSRRELLSIQAPWETTVIFFIGLYECFIHFVYKFLNSFKRQYESTMCWSTKGPSLSNLWYCHSLFLSLSFSLSLRYLHRVLLVSRSPRTLLRSRHWTIPHEYLIHRHSDEGTVTPTLSHLMLEKRKKK